MAPSRNHNHYPQNHRPAPNMNRHHRVVTESLLLPRHCSFFGGAAADKDGTTYRAFLCDNHDNLTIQFFIKYVSAASVEILASSVDRRACT
jgi:hypothetical protein